MSTRSFKVAFGFRKLTAEMLIDLARIIIKMLTGNLSVTSPNPSVADLKTLADDYETAKRNKDVAKSKLKECVGIEKQKRRLLERGLNSEARTVEIVAQGSKAIIESCGMPASKAPTPVHVGQVENLSMSRGANPGSVDADWRTMKDAKNYTINISHVAPDEHLVAPWAFYGTSSKSSATISGLQSGSGIWVQVCANGRRNRGAFSDVAFLIVP